MFLYFRCCSKCIQCMFKILFQNRIIVLPITWEKSKVMVKSKYLKSRYYRRLMSLLGTKRQVLSWNMNFTEIRACISIITNIGNRIINKYLKHSYVTWRKTLQINTPKEQINVVFLVFLLLLVLSLNVTSDLPNVIIISVLLSNKEDRKQVLNCFLLKGETEAARCVCSSLL